MAVPSRDTSRAAPIRSVANAAMTASAAALPTRSYEVQKFASGRWTLDSVSDDKEVAIAMARSLLASGRATLGVRVMSVQSNRDGQFSQITIFRQAPGEEPTQMTTTLKPRTQTEPARPQEKRDFAHSETRADSTAEKKRFADLILALKLAVGLGVALAAFQALRLALH
jgi:hypothetical protein